MYQRLIKLSSLLLIISASISFGMNISEGKDITRLALDLFVVICGIFMNILNYQKK